MQLWRVWNHFDQCLEDRQVDDLTRGLNLDQFLVKYTSEDSSSFMKLQEEDRRRFKERYSWMYDQADKANELNQLAIEGGGKSLTKAIENNSDRKEPLAIQYEQKGKMPQKQLVKANSKDQPKNMTAPRMQMCKSEAQSGLFFHPEDNYEPLLTLDDIEDRAGPDKEIKKLNTRLPTEFYVNFEKQTSKKPIIHEIKLDEEALKNGSS
jgi:hypothetical protein